MIERQIFPKKLLLNKINVGYMYVVFSFFFSFCYVLPNNIYNSQSKKNIFNCFWSLLLCDWRLNCVNTTKTIELLESTKLF